MAILDQGGNAVDAAIAMNAVQGVVAPETCGIGGDLFALVWPDATGQPGALNSSGRAGSGVDAAELRRAGHTEIPQRHPGAVPVPGCVDGWIALNSSMGSLELGTLLEPAIRLARDGFPANREMAAAFARRADELLAEEGAAAMYPGGRPPLEGQRISRPSLARALAAIAEKGREAFYAGPVGRGITTALDGAVTADDLARTQAEWVEPLSVEVFGHVGWTVPPNSQGYISLLALAILERLGLKDLEDPLSWHLSVEAYRVAAADRDTILADPDSMTTAVSDLVSDARIDRLAGQVSPDRVGAVGHGTPAPGGTAYMCVTDGNGMGVSLIQSNFYGIGSGRSVPEGGFGLHDRGRGFNLIPGHPNELMPGRRPLHTLSPSLWTGPDGLAAIVGTRGGHNQPQLVLQLVTHLLGRRLEPAVAMAVPRWATDVPDGTAESRVQVEPGLGADIIEGLTRRGHAVTPLEVPQSGWGPMSSILLDATGLAVGAADPRVDTAMAAAR